MIACPGDRILKSPFFLSLISGFTCSPGPKCPVWDQLSRFCFKTTTVLEPTYCNPEKECFQLAADLYHTPKCGRTNSASESGKGEREGNRNPTRRCYSRFTTFLRGRASHGTGPCPSQSLKQDNGWESLRAARAPTLLRQPEEQTLPC